MTVKNKIKDEKSTIKQQQVATHIPHSEKSKY